MSKIKTTKSLTLLIHVFIIAVLFSGCTASNEDVFYPLNDNTLRYSVLGDEIRFAVKGESLSSEANQQDLSGTATISWQASQLLTYPSNNLIMDDPLVLSSEHAIFNAPIGTYKFHFSRTSTGDLNLYAIQHNDAEPIWLFVGDATDPGFLYWQNLQPNPSKQTHNLTLKSCPNQVCKSVGSGTFSLQYIAKETQNTPYANFESYRYETKLQFSSIDDSFDADPFLDLKFNDWLYPQAGIVKRVFERTSSDSFISIILAASSTNIAF